MGEDLLIMENPNENTFEYTATALTKLVTFQISFSDMFKIPQRDREFMENVARTRRQVIVQRTLDLYHNLRSIKDNLDQGDNNNNRS